MMSTIVQADPQSNKIFLEMKDGTQYQNTQHNHDGKERKNRKMKMHYET